MTERKDDLDILSRIDERSFEVLYGMGYHVLASQLYPSIAAFEDRARGGRVQIELVRSCAIACYLVGDIHDINYAPKAAISWYQRAISLLPGYASAWREIGTRQSELGLQGAAKVSLLNALRLDPQDEIAKAELSDLGWNRPSYVMGDPCWIAAEALAIQMPERALAALERPESARALQWKACAHAAANDRAGLLAALNELRECSRPTSVCLQPELWFFLPEASWRDLGFWETLGEVCLEVGSAIPVDNVHLPARTTHDMDPMARVEAQKRALRGAE